jgi:hypothetical protein
MKQCDKIWSGVVSVAIAKRGVRRGSWGNWGDRDKILARIIETRVTTRIS